MKARFLLLGLIILLALTLGLWAFFPKNALTIVNWVGYPSVLLSFLGFGWFFWRSINWTAQMEKFRSGGWRIVVFILLLSAFLHLQETHGFKIVMDEVQLLSSAQHMHLTREAGVVAGGHNLGTNFASFGSFLDKRPLFFPFAVSLLHDFTGYRTNNPWILNLLLTPILLGLIYRIGSRWASTLGGIVSVLLWVTIPLFVQCAASSGFELLNLVMIASTIILGMAYAREPSSNSVGAFCFSGILMAQVRYESVLMVLPVAVSVAYVWWQRRRVDLPLAVILLPLLLVVYLLQLNVFKVNPGFWQLGDRDSSKGVFSILYFYDNVGHALNYFLSFNRDQPSSILIFIGGVVGIGFFPLWLRANAKRQFAADPEQGVFVIFTLSLCVLSLFVICFFWGAFDDVVTTRLSLPTQFLFLIIFIFIVPHITKHHRKFFGVLAGVCVVYIFTWTLPVISKRSYSYENLAAEGVNWMDRYIKAHDLKDTLVIDSQATLLWIAHEVSAVSIERLQDRPEQFLFHYKRNTFKEILVCQRMELASLESGGWYPMEGHDLGASVELIPIDQILLAPAYAVRLSRVKSVNEPAFVVDSKRLKQLTKDAKASNKMETNPAERAENFKEQQIYAKKWLENLP